MPWVKLDDKFPWHPKVVQAGPEAAWLHVCGLCYCAAHLTDGVLPKEALYLFAETRKAKRLAQRLVDGGLWYDRGETYEIHGFLEYNPSREYVEAERRWAKERSALNRDPELTRQIKQRDRDRCRYCGAKVNWTDRRSSAGGTYDHVIPRGPSTVANVVVACRACNMRKANRTPTEAGMDLIQIETSSDLEKFKTPDPTRPDPEVLSEPLSDGSKPTRRRTRTPFPESFTLREGDPAWAAEECPHVDVRFETKNFASWWRADGGLKANWHQAWRNWMTKAESQRATESTGRRFA